MTREELDEMTGDLDGVERLILRQWIDRGDGVAVYENSELGHPQLGHRKFVSFGGARAQLEGDAPKRLPDIGGEINWRYMLVGTYRPTQEEATA